MTSTGLYRVDALVDLRAALLSFRNSTGSVPDHAGRCLERVERRLRDALAQAHDQVLRCRQNVEQSADEEGEMDDYAVDELEAAESRLSQLKALLSRFSQVRSRCQADLSGWSARVDQLTARGAQFLGQADADARAYLGSGTSSTSSVGSAIRHNENGIGGSDLPVEPRHWTTPQLADSPLELPPLPAGFEWLPIGEIGQSEIPGALDPPKGVPQHEMTAGVERLWSEVLPLVGGTTDDMRERCKKFDEENDRVDRSGFVHKESVLGVWDAFFHPSNQIYANLSRRDGRISITNGRHRIQTARTLGWKYIPAKVVRHDL